MREMFPMLFRSILAGSTDGRKGRATSIALDRNQPQQLYKFTLLDET